MKNILNTTTDREYQTRKLFFKTLIPEIDIKNKKILDIGCGYGGFLKYSVENGVLEASGIEISKDDLKTARRYLKKDNVILKEGTALNLPFPNDYFDTVVSFEVLEHIPMNKEDKMFSEIYRVLKKKGVLYLTTPFDSFFSKYFDPAYYLIGHRHYSKKQIQSFTDNNKLKIIKLRTIGTFWEFINLYNLYFSKWILRREKIFENFIISKVLEDLKNEKTQGFMNIFVKAIKN